MTRECEINGYQKPAKFALNKTLPNGEKEWLHVCDVHELEIASENLRLVGRYVTKSKSRSK